MSKSKIKGIDVLDEMFPNSPEPENPEQREPTGDPGLAAAETEEKIIPPAKGAAEEEKGKNDLLASVQAKKVQKVLKKKETEKKQMSGSEAQIVAGEEEPEGEGFFTVAVKPTFKDTHRQDNIWLENGLYEDLFKIFENRPKGFKTEFYNKALQFAVKRYKEVNNRP